MADLSPAGKFLVACSRCGQVDDHPMHHMGVAKGSGDRPRSFHTDCHALLGCPICLTVRADVGAEKGAELQEIFLAQDPLTDEQVAELLGQTGQEA